MRLRLAGLALLAALAGPAAAQEAVSAADQAAIRATITRQLDAFSHDDAAGAFGLASPGIQALFGSPEAFMAMVRRGYAPVYHPRSADFAGQQEAGGAIVQDVSLIGPDGLAYTARYMMERQADGSWRIAGCSLLRRPGYGA